MLTLIVTQNDGTLVTTHPLDASLLEPLFTNALASASAAANFGTAATLTAKASAGKLFAARASNVNAAARFLQVHNTAGAPAGGAVPLLSIPIPAGTAAAPASVEFSRLFFGPGGLNLTAGVTLAVSTAPGTFVAATAADHTLNASYA